MLNRRKFLLGSIGAGIAALSSEHLNASVADPIRDLLKENVGPNEKVTGMVAVVVDADDARIITYGSSGVPGLALDGNTVVEIGSITKVFTALILVEMASRGEVAIDDPVTKYLPATVHLHELGRPITLIDLATYTSGLPKLPTNIQPDSWAKPFPFADYTDAKLYEFLSSYVPINESGSHYDYSNIGFALLGIALAHRAGKSYEQLVIERICNPLGLSHTRIRLSDDMRRHLAQAHDIKLNPTPLWDMLALQPAGAFRANVKDVTMFLKAAMGLNQTPLKSSLARLLETRRHTGVSGTDVGLGWFISSDDKEEIIWKTGLTGGFNTFLGFSKRNRRGAFLVSNYLWEPIDVGTTNLGIKLINPDFHSADFSSLYR